MSKEATLIFPHQLFKNSPALKAALRDMGYKLTNRASIGKTEMIYIHKDKIEVAADRRGDDSVAGF